MLFYTLLLFNLCSFVEVKDDFGLDRNVFNQLLDAIYTADRRKEVEHTFWTTMKNEVVSDLLPDYFVVPAIDGTFSGKYFCVTETRVYLKLTDTIPKISGEDILFSFPIWKTKKIKFTINFEFQWTKSLHFHMSSDGNKMVPVTYTFTTPGSVMFIFKIPDFSMKRGEISPECLLTVKEVQVHEVGVPKVDSNAAENHKALVELLNPLIVETYQEYVTAGIIKVLYEKKNSWICASNDLQRLYENSREIWQYDKKYQTFCEGAKANN